MKNSTTLLFGVISFLIVTSIFFVERRIVGVPVPFLQFFFIIIALILFREKFLVLGFFSENIIKKIILILLTSSIFGYILNYVNVDLVIKNYFYNTGERPNYLYLKMSFNGVLLLLLTYFSFSLGFSVKSDLKLINRIIRLIVNLTFLLAVVNIITWFISTRGVIARYNFKPILLSSYGINIQWSILGFLLLLSEKVKFNILSLKSVKLIIFAFSILIILSRLNQLLFLLSLLLYNYYNLQKFAKIKILLYGFFSILIISFILPFLNIFNSYNSLLNIGGEDFQIRIATFYSTLNIFYNHFLLGVGYGMFPGYNVATVFVQRTEVNLGSAHNGLASILSETGLVGLVIHFTLIYFIFKGVLRKIKFKFKNTQYKFTTPIKVFIVLNISILFTSNYFLFPPPSEYSYVGITIVSWILIGILISFNKSKSQS